MSSEKEKYYIINQIYYDKAGYGSIKRTHDAARANYKSISIHYVANWLYTNVGKKGQPKGTNSFVAPHSYYEYQFDLCLLEI